NEIEGRADLAGRVIGSTQTMLDEFASESAAAAGGVSAANLRPGQRASHRVGSVIVEFAKSLRRPAPITDVRFVPHFPIPRLHFSASVSLDAMLGPLEDEFRPLAVVFRRIFACVGVSYCWLD